MHALTIFLSSFLLFSVQPIITKQILPAFGGSSGVWLLSLLFFQTLLLGGYFYSYGVNRYLDYSKRIKTHIVLLLLSLVSLPIISSYVPDISNEYLKILCVLALSVGFPYFMLSTTTPLIQAFFNQRHPQANVYRLYSLSNAASLIALFSYPLFFEKYLSIVHQSSFWSYTYTAFVLVAVGMLGYSLKYRLESTTEKFPDISRNIKYKWLLYSFLGSALLCAITSHITQNVASIPLLWILPLAVYLVSFIVAFDYPKLFDKRFLEIALLIFVPYLCFSLLWVFTSKGIEQASYSVEINIFIYLLGLFLCVYYLNGLLVREKPDPSALTVFYVYIALGGVLGSLFVSVIAPLLFKSFIELQLLLSVLVLSIGFQFKNKILPVISLMLCIVINLAVYVGLNQFSIASERGFYGSLKVNEVVEGNENKEGKEEKENKENKGDKNEPKDPHLKTRFLIHGSIMHGFQKDGSLIPTSYYHRNSGFGQAVAQLQNKPSMHMGMIGMGVGTVASYTRDSDSLRFFEIDKLIVKLALENFTYIEQSQGRVDYLVGDGRLLVEKEPRASFDLLAVDAFTGDAIPIHLLTQEAIKMYMDKLKPDGILAFHISSSYVDLEIPIANIAKEQGLHYRIVEIGKDFMQTESKWILLSKGELKHFTNSYTLGDNTHHQRLWTDNYSNLLDILK